MAATLRQVTVYGYHKTVCNQIGLPQATFKHKALQGSVSTPSATGNTVYTGPGTQTTEPATTDTPVWAIWQEQPRAGTGADTTPIGREAVQRMRGQFPAIDDNQNVITVQHDDWLVDPVGKRFRVMNPVLSPDGGYWAFEMLRQR